MKSKKMYLVTGGTGFIGTALVRRLVEDGHEVRVVDNDLRGNCQRLNNLRNNIDLINADVCDSEKMIEAARGVDSIIHLAALNGTENFYSRPELVLKVGVKGMLAMLEAAKVNNIDEFILVSSSEVYQTPASVPTDERVEMCIPDPWNPRYSYGGSKLISEIMLANFNKEIFNKVIIIRPHNVYGADMGYEHVIPQLILRGQAMIKEHPKGEVPFKIQGDGKQTRSFVYIDDFIDGMMVAINKGTHRNVYHIGTQDEISIENLALLLFEYFKRKVKVEPMLAHEVGTLRRCPDITKLKQLGYSPKWSIHKGLHEVAGWYVNNCYAKTQLEKV